MRVLLISPNREEINMRVLPLGLASLAAATHHKGHEVKLLDLMEVEPCEPVVRELLKAFAPEVIGLSIRNIDDQKMASARFLLEPIKAIISWCRELSQAPVVLGGAGYSIFPEEALAFLEADMGLQGEGEGSFPLLLERLYRRQDLSEIPGLFLPGQGLQGKRTFIKDLDSLPWPQVFSWLRYGRNIRDYWMTVQTRRGCPMGCSYCSTAAIEGQRIRQRSPESVVEDMAQQMEAGLEQFYFTDNIFNLPPAYALALCHRLKGLKRKPRWRCILYPGKIDSTLAKAMAESGCIEASVGFETGSPGQLCSLNKQYTLDEVRRTFDLLGDQDIKRMGFLLLGGPGETRNSVEESLTFADSLPLEALKVTVGLRIYPQTPLAGMALKEGVITEKTNLLFPAFYLAPELQSWLPPTVKDWIGARPHWFM